MQTKLKVAVRVTWNNRLWHAVNMWTNHNSWHYTGLANSRYFTQMSVCSEGWCPLISVILCDLSSILQESFIIWTKLILWIRHKSLNNNVLHVIHGNFKRLLSELANYPQIQISLACCSKRNKYITKSVVFWQYKDIQLKNQTSIDISSSLLLITIKINLLTPTLTCNIFNINFIEFLICVYIIIKLKFLSNIFSCW